MLGRSSMLNAAMLSMLAMTGAALAPSKVHQIRASRVRPVIPSPRPPASTYGANRSDRHVRRDVACSDAHRAGYAVGRVSAAIEPVFNSVQERNAFLQGYWHGLDATRKAAKTE